MPKKTSTRLGQRPTPSTDTMWPLDVWLAALSGLVLYLTVTRLRFDDPRWLYNAWTYAVAVPVIALSLSLALRGLVSQFVQKSIQVGFLFSVFVHMLLLILAVNVVVFSQYLPEAFTGVKPERSPIRQTVPEYLFQTPQETAATPDWSKPVEAETTSRQQPRELRQLPPVEHSAAELELPRPKEPEPQPMPKSLMERQQQQQAKPMPADSPAKLARRELSSEAQTSPQNTAPDVPEIAQNTPQQTQSSASERELSSDQPRRQTTDSVSLPRPRAAIAQPASPVPSLDADSSIVSMSRQSAQTLPVLGELGLATRSRRLAQARQVEPAGASPSPQSIAVARIEESASQMLSPVDVSHQRRGTTQGAQLAESETPDAIGMPTSAAVSAGQGTTQRRDLSAMAGLPNVDAGQTSSERPRRTGGTVQGRFSPAGLPELSGQVASRIPSDTTATSGTMVERSDLGDSGAQRRARATSSTASVVAPDVAAGPSLDLMMQPSIAGLADRPDRIAGVIPSSDLPEVGVLDISNQPRQRREVGGPVTPAGAQVASVESFSRRAMRTQGGAVPTPAGVVGTATEEAIELGLAYLAASQNDDGSWSLDGHGEEVLLRSHTAATGLCLLAFQGAGYTHRQHQYANTVNRAVQFLVSIQKTNGDLFRSENPFSDQSVAFYSHGIAALAMCEAYGMTQDQELKPAAQRAIDFIGNTQHARYGGWRYAPQVSSDTSVSGWMMMALKSGELSGLEVPPNAYAGIDRWLDFAQESSSRQDRYRYNPFAANTPAQRHGRIPSPTMTAVGMLMRMYSGWRREKEAMRSAADYLLEHPPRMGTTQKPLRDGYYWYYATQVMFHMGGDHWERWNQFLNPLLLESQIKSGAKAGSWDPRMPVEDRWSAHGGRLYVTTMNLLNLEVYYRHLPIYDETAE